MKKFIAILAVLATLTAVGAFAQEEAAAEVETSSITLTASGTGSFVPLQIINFGKGHARSVAEDDDEAETYIYSGVGSNFGGKVPGITMTAKANTSKIGAQLDFVTNFADQPDKQIDADQALYWGLGDHAWIEGRPINMIRVRYGKYYWDDLRGKIGTDTAQSTFTFTGNSKSDIFERFGSRNMHNFGKTSAAGFLVTVNPIDAFTIAASVSGPGLAGGNEDFKETAEWVYQRGQVALGYNIAGIGLVRAQYIGDYDHIQHAYNHQGEIESLASSGPSLYDKNNNIPSLVTYTGHQRRIEAAFNLTMLEMVNIDIGAKFYLPVTANEISVRGERGAHDFEYSLMNPVVVAAGAELKMDPFKLLFGMRMDFAGLNSLKYDGQKTWTYEKPFGMNVHLTPSYDLGFGIVGGDLGFKVISAETVKYDGDEIIEKIAMMDMGIAAWFQLPVGTGWLCVAPGVAIIDLAGKGGNDDYDDDSMTKVVFTLPVMFNYAF